jgi:hypothetical protein
MGHVWSLEVIILSLRLALAAHQRSYKQLPCPSQLPLQQSEQSDSCDGLPAWVHPQKLSPAHTAEQHWLLVVHAMLSARHEPASLPASLFAAVGQNVVPHWTAQSEQAHVHQLTHSLVAFDDALLSQLEGQFVKLAHWSTHLLSEVQTESPSQFLACVAQSLPDAWLRHIWHADGTFALLPRVAPASAPPLEELQPKAADATTRRPTTDVRIISGNSQATKCCRCCYRCRSHSSRHQSHTSQNWCTGMFRRRNCRCSSRCRRYRNHQPGRTCSDWATNMLPRRRRVTRSILPE